MLELFNKRKQYGYLMDGGLSSLSVTPHLLKRIRWQKISSKWSLPAELQDDKCVC